MFKRMNTVEKDDLAEEESADIADVLKKEEYTDK